MRERAATRSGRDLRTQLVTIAPSEPWHFGCSFGHQHNDEAQDARCRRALHRLRRAAGCQLDHHEQLGEWHLGGCQGRRAGGVEQLVGRGLEGEIKNRASARSLVAIDLVTPPRWSPVQVPHEETRRSDREVERIRPDRRRYATRSSAFRTLLWRRRGRHSKVEYRSRWRETWNDPKVPLVETVQHRAMRPAAPTRGAVALAHRQNIRLRSGLRHRRARVGTEVVLERRRVHRQPSMSATRGRHS